MNKEREREILTMLLASEKKTLSVSELAKSLYTSESSIRRDLASLEQKQLIKRTHGGAAIEENSISAQKIPFVIRELEQSDAKVEMAKKATNYVNNCDVIFLDASSSAYNLVPYLAMKKGLTVITSGIKTLTKLGEYGIRAISTGGILLPSCQSLVGNEAQLTVSHFNADACFFSCRGLSPDKMLTDISQPENAVRLKMIQHSARSYLLCTSNKINRTFYHNLCRAEDITGIIKADAPDELTEPTLGQTNKPSRKKVEKT